MMLGDVSINQEEFRGLDFVAEIGVCQEWFLSQQLARRTDWHKTVEVLCFDKQLASGMPSTGTWLMCFVGLGVGPEIMVCICMDTARWAVVVMVAVLKAGGFVLLMACSSLYLERRLSSSVRYMRPLVDSRPRSEKKSGSVTKDLVVSVASLRYSRARCGPSMRSSPGIPTGHIFYSCGSQRPGSGRTLMVYLRSWPGDDLLLVRARWHSNTAFKWSVCIQACYLWHLLILPRGTSTRSLPYSSWAPMRITLKTVSHERELILSGL